MYDHLWWFFSSLETSYPLSLLLFFSLPSSLLSPWITPVACVLDLYRLPSMSLKCVVTFLLHYLSGIHSESFLSTIWNIFIFSLPMVSLQVIQSIFILFYFKISFPNFEFLKMCTCRCLISACFKFLMLSHMNLFFSSFWFKNYPILMFFLLSFLYKKYPYFQVILEYINIFLVNSSLQCHFILFLPYHYYFKIYFDVFACIIVWEVLIAICISLLLLL